MRKYLFVVLVVIVAIYLNRAYARFFDYIGEKKLADPNTQKFYLLESSTKSGDIKYIALGDSLTAGVGSRDYKETYAYFVAEDLTKKSKKVKFINLGQPSASIDDVIRNQLPEVLKEDPEYVSIMIGINDVFNFKTLEYFKKSYQQLLDQLSAESKAKIIVCNIPFLGSDDLLLPPFNSFWDFRIKQFNSVIKQVSEEKAVRYVDIYSFSRNLFNQNMKLYSADQFHPSGEGYKLWGQFINAN